MDIKESEFYKEKHLKQKIDFERLCKLVPDYVAKAFIKKELSIEYSSLNGYIRDCITFFNYLKECNPICQKYENIINIPVDILKNLNDDDIGEYEKYLDSHINKNTNKPITNNSKTIQRKLTSLNVLFKYLLSKEYINKNPMEFFDMPKIPTKKIIIRMDSSNENNEINRFLEGVESILYNNKLSEHQKAYIKKDYIRDKAILYLLLGTGIRVSECQGIDFEHINFDNNSIMIKRKGGSYDIVYFNDLIKEKLLEYKEYREDTDKNIQLTDTKAFFISAIGNRISVDAIENITKKYTKILLGKSLSPHKFRATYATFLYKETKDIKVVADVLGHASPAITATTYAAQTTENKQKAGSIPLK